MTKQDFIEKWISWVSYTNREKLTNEMESDLESVSQSLRIHDVVWRSEQLCDLNGKTVLAKFKVTKHIPKIIIEDI